jgi:excisionase family DNA binding protein
MNDIGQTVENLRETSEELRRRGIDDLAQKLDQAIADLGTPTLDSGNLVTMDEAAHLLGVRSVTTIIRWIADGALEAVRRDRQILIPRASVDAMMNKPHFALYKAWRQELDEALAPFDAGDEPLPLSETLWEGRKPWEQHCNGAGSSTGR